jgi:hypothetical protein
MFEKQINAIEESKNSKFELTKKAIRKLKFYRWVNKLFTKSKVTTTTKEQK